jgi:hypothetical protein
VVVTFRPVNPRNAVLEAVVLLHFDRPVLAPEAAAVRALHPRVKHDLPRLDELQVATIAFGPAMPSVPPGTPVSMASFKKDGTLETRVLLHSPLLAVNFLLYTRWDELWPKASAWIRMVVGALGEAGTRNGLPPLRVAVCGHQMINVFVWEGDASGVTAMELFAQKPPRLAGAAWNAAGQAWFAVHSANEPLAVDGVPAALIDSLSFDLAEEQRVGWRLRLEQTLEARFVEPLALEVLMAKQREGGQTLLDTLAGQLHDRSRMLMRSLLPAQMLEQIGMDPS